MHVIKRDASSKKGKLLCCKCIFDQIKANLAEIQPENHQNVKKKNAFLAKSPKESTGYISTKNRIREFVKFYSERENIFIDIIGPSPKWQPKIQISQN